MQVKGRTVTLGSIVEGTEWSVEPQTLEWPFTEKEFWDAIDWIEDEAGRIWSQTHGCEGCAELWGFVDEQGFKIDGSDSMTPIHPECKLCKGEGVII